MHQPVDVVFLRPPQETVYDPEFSDNLPIHLGQSYEATPTIPALTLVIGVISGIMFIIGFAVGALVF